MKEKIFEHKNNDKYIRIFLTALILILGGYYIQEISHQKVEVSQGSSVVDKVHADVPVSGK